MKNDKNTDDLIREKLEGFVAPPPPHIWNNVQRQLAMQQRRTRLTYMRWVAVAAVVLLAFLGGWYFNSNVHKAEMASVESSIVQTKPEKQNNVTDPFVMTENEMNKTDASAKISNTLLLAELSEEVEGPNQISEYQIVSNEFNKGIDVQMEEIPSTPIRFHCL